MTRTHQITDLLKAWSRGDPEALEKLVPLVDRELKRIAHGLILNERTGHPLRTNDLVNEAFLSLLEDEPIDWKSRKQFYAIVAWRMRNILTDYARKRLSRGQDAEHVDIDEVLLPMKRAKDIVDLHEALTSLARVDDRKAKVVELRYFGGFTLEEIASMLGVAPTTVERDWRFARSWLKREITGQEEE